MPAFRDFLYLNERAIDDYLASQEGGLYDEEREKHSTSGDRALGGSVGSGIAKVEGKAGKATAGEIERVRRQVAASRYDRLHGYMTESKALQDILEPSGSLYGEIKPLQLVQLSCDIELPQFMTALSAMDALGPLVDLMKAMAPETVDAETEAAFGGMQAMGKAVEDSLAAIGRLDENSMPFVIELERQWLRVEPGNLAGAAIVVGKVLRKIPEGKRYSYLKISGLDLNSFGEQAPEAQPQEESPDMFVEGPAAVMSTVAIFR